jgi:hypothetical protein
MKALSTEEWVVLNLSKMTDLELDELFTYVNYLKEVKDNGLKLFDQEIKQMFNRYNNIFGAQEYGYHCPSCRTKVYKDYQKLPKYITNEREKRLRETN